MTHIFLRFLISDKDILPRSHTNKTCRFNFKQYRPCSYYYYRSLTSEGIICKVLSVRNCCSFCNCIYFYIILITKLRNVKQEMLLMNRFFEARFFHLQKMQMVFCKVKYILLLEPRHEKTNNVHMRKQRRRSASR